MPYLYNIPLATDKLSISQGNIQANFNALGAIAGNTNASSSALSATSGLKWVYLPSNASLPPSGSAFPAGEVAIYGAPETYTGPVTRNELWINKTIAAGVAQISMTGSSVSRTAPAAGQTGWTNLPSGIKLVWGNSSGTANAVKTVTLTGDATFTTTGIAVILTPYTTGVTDPIQLSVVSKGFNTANTFQCIPNNNNGAGTVEFTYLAIGF